MKRSLLALVLLLGGCAAKNPVTVIPPPPTSKDFTVTVTFNYNFTNFTPCSATATVGCVSGFTWGYLQGTTQVPLKTSPVTICSGASQPETCTDTTNSVVGFGAVVPYVTANGINNAGANQSSVVDQGGAVNIALGAATNVNETFQ